MTLKELTNNEVIKNLSDFDLSRIRSNLLSAKEHLKYLSGAIHGNYLVQHFGGFKNICKEELIKVNRHLGYVNMEIESRRER